MPYTVTPKQWQAAKLVATGELASDIDKKLKLRNNTLARWQRIPAFMAAVERHVREMEDAYAYKLRAMRYTSVCRLYNNTKHWRENNPGEMTQMIKLLHIAETVSETHGNATETASKRAEMRLKCSETHPNVAEMRDTNPQLIERYGVHPVNGL